MQNIIDIDPKSILEFEAEENKLAYAKLTLQNLLPQQIAFKIKTTVPQLFQVKPSVGFIDGNRSLTVEISTTQAIGQDQKFEAKFQINACVTNQNEQDLNSFWKNRDQSTIQTCLLKSKLKYHNLQDQQWNQQQQQVPNDSKLLESSVFNSSHSDSKMFKSVKEDSQKDEILKQYKDQFEKLSQEYQIFKKKVEQDQFINLSKKEQNIINTKQALIAVIIALVIGYIIGK